VPEVRLVGEDGKQIGVIKTDDALVYAQERDLDLVEVAPEARPPVCRVLDYSKYKYEQAQKQKAARKHQQQITIREIKFRPKIAQNDYDTKKGHVKRFLTGRDRVKVTIMFRGREVTHPERGTALLNRLAEELSDVAVVEQVPLQDGRNMTMMLGPSKSVLAAAEAKDAAEGKIAADEKEASDARRAAEGKVVAPNPAGLTEPEAPGEGDAAAPTDDAAKVADPTQDDVEDPAKAGDSGAVTNGVGRQNGAAETAAPAPSDAPA